MANSASSFDLVVLAAGMGSRFGGIKQVEPVGPNGELIIEYSAFDALRAGFDRLVLVIRKDIEADFRATIGRRLEQRMDVQYVHQELDTQLAGRAVPVGRTKPWGTAHATLTAREAVRGPFAVINADDFYGASGYRILADHFRTSMDFAMVGYPLGQTLSEHGTVSRGLCTTDADGGLKSITEITKIEKTADGARYVDAEGGEQRLSGAELVSMNFWGLTPAVFPQLERQFRDFLATRSNDPKAEIYLPTCLSGLIEQGTARIALHRSTDAWFGLTYREDLAAAQLAIRELIAAGRYPAPLWD